MKDLTKTISAFLMASIIFSCTTSKAVNLEKDEIQMALQSGEYNTNFIIDDFASRYEEDPLGDYWWMYKDSKGSEIEISLDKNEANSFRIDYSILPSLDGSNTYAGAESKFEEANLVTDSMGLYIKLKSSAAGLKYYFVAYTKDPTQTSPFSLYKSPFQVELYTTEESIEGFVEVIIPWNLMHRSYWPGEGGTEIFVPEDMDTIEIAFENTVNEGQEGTIWIDEISIISDKIIEESKENTEKTTITSILSQAGFRPQDPKTFISTEQYSSFQIFDKNSSMQVYEGILEYEGIDQDTGLNIYKGDFSDFTEYGTYYITTGENKSCDFSIADDIFTEPLSMALKAFYFQRSGMDVIDSDTGINSPAGHTSPAVLWSDQNSQGYDVSGGWYDAGDYGRYMPTATFTINQLIYAYLFNTELNSSDATGIPESGNNIPDILDEIRYELEWMNNMHNPDGSVFHKVTTRDYPATTLPFLDTATLYLFGPSGIDTAMYIAATALAIPVFKDFDPQFAEELTRNVLLSWQWLRENPFTGFENPSSSEYPMQGGYDLSYADFDNNEAIASICLWAAAEMFKLTGDRKFEEAFIEGLPLANPEERFRSMSWADTYNLALYSYLTAENTNSETKEAVSSLFREQADMISETLGQSAFGTALKGGSENFEYVWSSNQVVCANGLLLVMAHNLFDNQEYLNGAYSQIQYILGFNGLGKCYFTGFGTNPVENPHHNMSMTLGFAIPGLVGEGPNGQSNDSSGVEPGLRALWRAGTPPALCYYDNSESYATNEPTIDTNGSFTALVSAYLRASQ